MLVIPAAQEAEAGGSRVQSQPQQQQGTSQLSETLSLNKAQNRAGDAAQWSSAPEFSPGTKTNKQTERIHKRQGEEDRGRGDFVRLCPTLLNW